MNFSQRMGILPVTKAMQINSIDEELMNGLWNALTIIYWTKVEENEGGYSSEFKPLFGTLWLDFFKAPIDTLPSYWKRHVRNNKPNI